MVRGTGVYEPHVFGVGGAYGVCGVGGHHRVRSMPHYEESAVVRVFRIRGIICELSACGSRFTLLLSALFFVMAEISALFAFVWVLTDRDGVEAPPSCEGSSMASFL